MDQNPPRLCPRCGTPVQPNQRFCSECGTTLNVASNLPTAMASGEQSLLAAQGSAGQSAPATNGSGDASTAPTELVGAPGQTPGGQPLAATPSSGAHFYSEVTDANPIPPPPPPDSLIAPFYQTSSSYQTPSGTPAQATPAPSTYSVPDYARAPRRSRLGMVVSLVLLLLLVLGGVTAYVLFFHKPGNNTVGNQGTPSTQNTLAANSNTPASNTTPTTGTGNSTPGSGSTATTGNGATSEDLSLKFTYASINITITNVQYATSFADDTNTPGGVRIAFTENNPTNGNPDFLYSGVARLILPDQSSIAPTGELHDISADSQTTRQNWLDFPVTSPPANLAQFVLQMGITQDNQMQIPLAPGADLSKYQPKTVTPGTTFHYAGLNWTLKSAVESLSVADKQATTGNVYITVTLSAFNPQANEYSAYYGDYIRLAAGNNAAAPTSDSTLNTLVASQTSITGTVVFLVPQGSTAYTLDMLANTTASPPIQEVKVPFTIQ